MGTDGVSLLSRRDRLHTVPGSPDAGSGARRHETLRCPLGAGPVRPAPQYESTRFFLTAVDPRVSAAADAGHPQVGAASLRDVVAAYIGLTKPRIIELLLVTTVPTMVLAADGIPSLALVAATLATERRGALPPAAA